MKVGIVGTGVMGYPMAENLLRAGFEVHVWNRTPQKARPLLEQGARWAQTPRELASRVDIVGVMLANHEVTRAVFHGEDGLLAGLKEGVWVVDHGTNPPAWAREAHREVTLRGAQYVDVPVLGSRPQAEARALVLLAGGDPETLAPLLPYFQAIGKHTIYTGVLGQGCLLKLNLNLMIALVNAALAEGFAMARQFGLDPAWFVEALKESALASPYIAIKGDKLLAGDFSEQFGLRLMTKDLRLIIEEALAHRFPLVLGAAAFGLYQRMENAGLGGEDVIAVVRAWDQNLPGSS